MIMETKTYNETSSYSHHHHAKRFVDRVKHAICDPIQLLYRSDPEFFVLGATGNVYIVNVSTNPSCTCPDRATPCKHILFVLIKVLGLPLDDSCLRKGNLKPCQLERLWSIPSSVESLAGHTLRERFHQMYFLKKELGDGVGAGGLAPCVEVNEGSICPICLNEVGKSGERLVSCGTCKIPVHEECLMAWKKTQRRKLTRCVTCRSRLEDKTDQERYLNLADYVRQNDHGSV